MRLILILAGVISVVCAHSRGGGPPPRNSIRRGGPFYHHHGTPRVHPDPRRPSRSHYSHHSSHNSRISHGLGHGHYPNPSYGGGGGGQIVSNNYAYVAGGSHGGHGHPQNHGHHQRQHVFGVPGGGQALTSLTQAFSPVQPPIVSISPIIPYQPGGELPGAEALSGHGHGPDHSANPHGHGQGHEHGKSTISKSVYVFSAPPDPSDHVRQQIVKQFPPQKQKHYQVLFINAPNPPPHPQHTVELPQPPEMKTQIYVLVKKPQPAPPVKIIPANVPVHKPEVFFIRYKNHKDGAAGFVPVPSDAPIAYPHPQVVDYGQPQPHPELETIYQDQPQLLQQPHGEYQQNYNGLVPIHEHQQEQHHHQPIEYIPQEQSGGHGYGGQEQYSAPPQETFPQQYAPHHGHQQHYGGAGDGIQYTVGGGDPYSDYSRLSAHFSTVTGRPVTFNSRSSPSPSSKPSSPKKRRLRSKPSISRIDNDNDPWTPLVPNTHKKRELEAEGMSGL